MKTAVTVDSHFFKTPDGKYWCTGITDNTFFERYTKVFDQVFIVSRVKNIDKANNKMILLNDNINVFEMPFARGIKDYVKYYLNFRKKSKEIIKIVDCAIFRLPSILSYIVAKEYIKSRKPFSIEVVACPKQAYQNNKIASMFFSKQLKQYALSANGASYVTEFNLQQSYPNYAMTYGEDKKHFATHYSSIDLRKEFFSQPKINSPIKSEFIISHTANKTASLMKGQDILIKALGILTQEGYNAKIKFIGDSEIKDYLYNIAKECSVENRIEFTGMLASKEEIRENLLNSDIFVLPTKAEGLPRAIIEAMAVGLPCISTPVNGVPELIPQEYLVDQQDYMGFAKLIGYLIDNSEIMNKISIRNINKAKEYEYEILDSRRTEFYKKLFNITKEK